MNEITSALRVANATFKTVRIIDAVIKKVAVGAVVACGIIVFYAIEVFLVRGLFSKSPRKSLTFWVCAVIIYK